jgi:hypothetical protein
MKILVVSPHCIVKSPGAAEKDIAATVALLADMGHDVVFYTMSRASVEDALMAEYLGRKDVSVHVFVPRMTNWLNWVYRVFQNPAFLDRAAYSFDLLVRDKEFQEVVEKGQFAVVFTFCSYSWPVLSYSRRKGIATIFRSHNYEASFFWESLDSRQRWSPVNWIRYRAKIIGEMLAVKMASVIGALPFEEISLYRKWKSEGVFVFTLTFPWKYLREPFVRRNKKPLDVFFLGANYQVVFHLRGAQFLIEKIIPEVQRMCPQQFRFHICGSKLPTYLQNKCDGKNVIYEGYVDDFEAFMENMDIGAFPVFTGKTMKGKVFESLCRAFPVVIPRNCLGGYVLENENEVLIADTEQEFVDGLVSLVDDDKRYMLSKGASEFAKREFGRDKLVYVMEDMLAYALKDKNAR